MRRHQRLTTSLSLLLLCCAIGLPCCDVEPIRWHNCASDSDCDPGLHCKKHDLLWSSCVSQAALGEGCDQSDRRSCAPGLECVSSRCVVPGSLVAGDRCDYNVNCSGGLICDWSQRPSRCGPPKQFGESCGHDTDCESGDCQLGVCRCDKGCPGSSVCSVQGCIPPNSLSAGAECRHNIDCADGNVCLWARKPYVCAPAATIGEACGHDTDCADGLACDQLQLVCQPLCWFDSECPSGERCIGRTLNGLLTFVCAQPAPLGGPCITAMQCDAGLACISEVCSAPKELGTSCVSSDECAPNAFCEPDSNVCVPDLPKDESCPPWSGSNSSCQSGLFCQRSDDAKDGVCVPLLGEGSACRSLQLFGELDCAPGLLCGPDPDGELRCLKPAP